MTTSTEKTTDLLAAVLADLAPVVAGVTEQQKNDPTPCSDYDVAQLTDHVTGWLSTFADGFADPDGQAPRASLDGYVSPPDPAAEVRRAAATMEKALRDGAAARPLKLGGSAMPGELALGMILWEYQMHGWDLARATGQPYRPDPVLVRAALEFAERFADLEGGPFGPSVAVPADAPPFDRLLGATGRDRNWTPGG
jgi:uncharacterized protein (TIGR03086 family)